MRFSLFFIVPLSLGCSEGIPGTVLTFDCTDGFVTDQLLDQLYGDRVIAPIEPGFGFQYGGAADTPHVAVSYSSGTRFHPSLPPENYGDLRNVIYSSQLEGPLTVTLRADQD